ncbi:MULTISPECIES: hypothetical protein [Actinomadura]|uniref:PH domain-containing protein n=1 Tax=Actinomadura yumaensis TaxID=111807 RepID=A0ABW2CHW7_9ACTN|nr:hypothetical protein [Actinomadura sp. J1-007]MWK36988.1 hypothetical protein [Actinomadura sp. J1-007]
MSPGTRRELGSGGLEARPSAGSAFAHAWNDVGFTLFLVGLFAAVVGGTIGRQWEVILGWLLWIGLFAYAWLRWRDRTPQRAWLDGTVLTVRTGQRIRRCDLATARSVRLGSTVTAQGDEAFSVLQARDAVTGVKVRYVLRTVSGHRLPAEDLRILADVVETGSRPATSAPALAAKLREIAQYGRELGSSERVDWSHRTTHREPPPH